MDERRLPRGLRVFSRRRVHWIARADGRYRLGTARGSFVQDEAGVSLDGVPAQWGRGAFTVDSAGLTFRFLRGVAQWEEKYERAPSLATR